MGRGEKVLFLWVIAQWISISEYDETFFSGNLASKTDTYETAE